jgi:Zn-dependent metalloprotease
MDDYRHLPLDRKHDYGGVHINSNIHNKAAHNLISSGRFQPDELVHLFYGNLMTYLSRKSTFRDSLTGLVLTARTLFRGRDEEEIEDKTAAIAKAFATWA